MDDAAVCKRVSLVAIPEAVVSTIAGIYDVLNAFAVLAETDAAVPVVPPFEVAIVGERAGPVALASGLALEARSGIADVARADIVIVPSVLLRGGGWARGRRPALVEWLRAMHAGGAQLCSACSGVFLLAETGLFDDRDATVHWGYSDIFRSLYPRVRVHPERALVVAGSRDELVSSGASTTWHDLVLYLVARHVGAVAAQAVARFFALQWHQDGLAPYMVFEGRRGHGDAVVLAAQEWLARNVSAPSPVEALVQRAGLPERTFKRRFGEATGLSPIAYVQRLRVEEAKRRLERTAASVDEVAWRVGYEDPAFFRRLFKRIAGVSPGVYRRRYRVPAFGAQRGEGAGAPAAGG